MADAHAALVRELGFGRYQNEVVINGHALVADEPVAVGGDDAGPSPYEFLCAGLGACTSMTLRMVAERKGYPLVRVTCHVVHDKQKLETPIDGRAEIDVFTRTLTLEGDLDAETRQKLLDIANKCPVHRTLSHASRVETVLG